MSKTLSRLFLVISLFSFGFIAAVVMLSDFDWTEHTKAQEQITTPVSSVSKADAALQPNVQGSLQDFNNAFVRIAESITPSVVTINTEQVIEHPDIRSDVPPQFEDWFDRFFPREEDMTRQVLGSGVIVQEDGYILTNNHVVARGKEITVKLADGREFTAEEVMTDPRSDLAVVQIDESGLPAIEMGDSDELQVGEWVVAIGSPFSEELRHTVTAGIVSAKGRTSILSQRDLIQDFIQTDAAINPGNSGGALVNLYGQLVGINTAIATQSRGYQGIGFAIPVNMAIKVMNDLIERGRVVRSYIGVEIRSVDSEIAQAMGMDRPYGALVNNIMEGSPAARSNLQEGDVIVAVDDQSVESSGDLQTKISQLQPGTDHELTVVRGGNQRTFSITVEVMPQDYGELASREQQEGRTGGGTLGMTLENITPDMARRFDLPTTSGVLVTGVQSGTPAAEKGIQRGDIITHVGVNTPVENVSEFRDAMEKYDPGDAVLLRIRRGDQSFFVGLTIPEA
ncbi:MAG TPA: DegQ family serine endoprotease [bacterium]|nr:DegQ family serine endoprotease [bacterium]